MDLFANKERDKERDIITVTTNGGYFSLKEDKINSTSGDPFTQLLHLTTWDTLKIIINALWLFPIRMFLLAITLSLGLTISAIAAVNDPNRPLQGWRKVLIHSFGVRLNRLILFIMGFHWIKTIGTPAPPSIAPIRVVAPHSSFFDLQLCCLDCVPTIVAKAEARNIPIFGRLIDQTLKTIFVARMDSGSRQECYSEIINRINSEHDWPPVLIYPEGTTTNRQAVIRFKHGAFKPQVTVQPIVIRYKNKLNTMVWSENGINVMMSLFATVCQFHNHVEIEYMPVYTPSNEEKENPTLYAENIQTLIARSLGVPASQHTLEDVLLGREAKRLGLPFSCGVIEYGLNAKPFNVSLDWVKSLLYKFSLIDRNKDGYISVYDIVHYMRIKHDENINEIFDELDKSKNGFISFKDYISGLLAQSRYLFTNEILLQNIFNYLDNNNDGLITHEDIHSLAPPTYCPPKEGMVNNSRTILPIYWLSREERRERREGITPHFYDLQGTWDYNQFQSLMSIHLDFLMLFYKYYHHSNQTMPLSNNEVLVYPPSNTIIELT